MFMLRKLQWPPHAVDIISFMICACTFTASPSSNKKCGDVLSLLFSHLLDLLAANTKLQQSAWVPGHNFVLNYQSVTKGLLVTLAKKGTFVVGYFVIVVLAIQG